MPWQKSPLGNSLKSPIAFEVEIWHPIEHHVYFPRYFLTKIPIAFEEEIRHSLQLFHEIPHEKKT